MAKTKAQRRAEKQQKRAIKLMNKLAKGNIINAQEFEVDNQVIIPHKGTQFTDVTRSTIGSATSTPSPVKRTPVNKQSKLSKRALKRKAKKTDRENRKKIKVPKVFQKDERIDTVEDIIEDIVEDGIEETVEDIIEDVIEEQEFTPIQEQHITDVPAIIDIIQVIRDRLNAIERDPDARPIQIEANKQKAIYIFEDTVSYFEDNIEELVNYLSENESRISELIEPITYASEEEIVEQAFVELFVILNMGALTPTQAMAVSDLGEYYE